MLTRNSVDRFWAKAERGAPGVCWEWRGDRHGSTGYGRVMVGGVRYLAHRLAFFLHYGVRPTVVVRHSCDNTYCVNPAHLLGGTQGDNIKDAYDRKRRPKIRPNAKLDMRTAEEIRAKYSSGVYTQAALGSMFGVPQAAISRIVRRESWA